MLVSNAVDKAPTIEEPALSRPDDYKAHFIKQGKGLGIGVIKYWLVNFRCLFRKFIRTVWVLAFHHRGEHCQLIGMRPKVVLLPCTR